MLEEYKGGTTAWRRRRGTDAEPKTFHDNLMGKALKHEKVIDASLNEIKALQDTGVLEVVPCEDFRKSPSEDSGWTRTRAMSRRRSTGTRAMSRRRSTGPGASRGSNARCSLCGDAAT